MRAEEVMTHTYADGCQVCDGRCLVKPDNNEACRIANRCMDAAVVQEIPDGWGLLVVVVTPEGFSGSSGNLTTEQVRWLCRRIAEGPVSMIAEPS